jgi:photosystem II stability/assembly factor-like uncharacterized protein
VNSSRGVLVGAVMICAILMAFTMSYPLAQPGHWVDINQTTYTLRSVFMLSLTVGWAVGDSGTILLWNGFQWTLVQSPTTLDLHSVFFPDVSNPNDGWIVGQSDGSFPAILHWDGVAWVRLDTTLGISWAAGQVGDLWSVYFLSPSDGWAVGAPGTVTNIVHWSGSWGAGGSWTTKASPDVVSTFYSVQVLSNTATPVGGYMVGGVAGASGAILYWDGANWNKYVGTVPAAALRSISMISSTDAWAVGDAIVTNPTVIRLSGTTWGGPMSISALGIRNLYSVVAIDANNAVAVGSLMNVGATDIIKFTTPSWTAVSSPATVDLFSVCKVPSAPSELWAVGAGGTILLNTSSASGGAGTWRVLTSPVGAGDLRVPPRSPNLRSVHFTSPSDGWAVGDNGTIIEYDGITWSTYQTAPIVPNNLTSVYTISPTDGWAVGANGTILRLTSSGWGVVARCGGPTCLQNVTLRSVFELTTGGAWAVGNASNAGSGPATILHWIPPGPWSQVPSNTANGANLNSIFLLADGSEGWAVGDSGTKTVIDHWKSGVWTVVTYNPPFAGSLALDSVVIVNNNPSNVWATGTSSSSGGIALHYDGTIWSPTAINQAGLTGWTTISFVPGSTDDAWIVGGPGPATGGQTLHWDGTTWTDIPLMPGPFVFPTFRSVQMLGPNEGWAMGDLGHIIRLGPRPFVTTTITSTSIIPTSVTFTSVTIVTSTTSSGPTTTTSTWGVPGFPIESVFAGLLGGLIVLTIIRRRRRL